jgi:hypothetical protein
MLTGRLRAFLFHVCSLKILINKGEKKRCFILRFKVKVFIRQAKNNKTTWKKNKMLPPEIYLTVAKEKSLLNYLAILIY